MRTTNGSLFYADFVERSYEDHPQHTVLMLDRWLVQAELDEDLFKPCDIVNSEIINYPEGSNSISWTEPEAVHKFLLES